MSYLALILLIFTNAGETIGYKSAKGSAAQVALGVTLWSTIFSIPASLVAACFRLGTPDSSFAWGQLGWLFLLAFLGIFTIYCWSKASQNLPMSVAEGVSEIYIALLAIVCWALFGKSLNGWQIGLVAATIALCIGLGFAQGAGNKSLQTTTRYNTKAGFIFLGIWIVLSVFKGALPAAVTDLPIWVYLLVQNVLMLIITALVQLKTIKATIVLVLASPSIMFISLCRVISQICVFYLATRMNLGVADAVSVSGLVLIMLYERLVFKERIKPYCYPILLLLTAATIALCVL